MLLADPTSDPVPERAAQRQGQVIDSHRPAPLLGRKEVGDQGWGDDAVARLADAQERPPEKHVAEVHGEGRADRGEAPEADAAREQHPAVIAIAEPAHEGRDDRVNDHEGDAQNAVPLVVDREVMLDLRPNGEKRVAVDVVQQVHAKEHGQGEPRTPDDRQEASLRILRKNRLRTLGRWGLGGSGRHDQGASTRHSRTNQINRYTRSRLNWRGPLIQPFPS